MLSRSIPGYGFGYGLGRRLVNAAVLVFALVAPVQAAEIKLLVLGDSLTAGWGLARDDGFPRQLERALKAKNRPVRVIDAGVSGDTTAGGAARLEWALAESPQAAIVALGGNDGLRGLAPTATKANLEAIATGLEERGVKILVAGMKAPPNLGREYGAEFEAVFADVAKKHGARLYPFFLDGVAANPALNLADGIHPTAQGVAVMVERILPSVERLIASVE